MESTKRFGGGRNTAYLFDEFSLLVQRINWKTIALYVYSG
jgi:hypothetical protein